MRGLRFGRLFLRHNRDLDLDLLNLKSCVDLLLDSMQGPQGLADFDKPFAAPSYPCSLEGKVFCGFERKENVGIKSNFEIYMYYLRNRGGD
jgi:hypothetical protein